MIRAAYKLLSILGSVKAASRGSRCAGAAEGAAACQPVVQPGVAQGGEAVRPPDALPVAENPGADLEEPETPEQAMARRIEAFAARSARHRQWAQAFVGSDDPLFAIACELVDHEARLDALAEQVQSLRFKLSQHVDGER